jgi:hypothetical protein
MGERRGGRSRPDVSGIGRFSLVGRIGRRSPGPGIAKRAVGRSEGSIQGGRVEVEPGRSSEQGRGRKAGAVEFKAMVESGSVSGVECQPAATPRMGRSGAWQPSAFA